MLSLSLSIYYSFSLLLIILLPSVHSHLLQRTLSDYSRHLLISEIDLGFMVRKITLPVKCGKFKTGWGEPNLIESKCFSLNSPSAVQKSNCFALGRGISSKYLNTYIRSIRHSLCSCCDIFLAKQKRNGAKDAAIFTARQNGDKDIHIHIQLALPPAAIRLLHWRRRRPR